MEIKCPICGKKYHYDSKICQACEDYSIYSGITKSRYELDHKWNCSVFIGIETLAFKPTPIYELIKDLTPEPNNFITNKGKAYNWNSEFTSKYERELKSSSGSLTLGNFSIIKRDRSDASLLYE